MEWELCLQIIVGLLHEKSRRMLNYRILGFPGVRWSSPSHIGKTSQESILLRTKQGARQIARSRAKGAGHSKESD